MATRIIGSTARLAVLALAIASMAGAALGQGTGRTLRFLGSAGLGQTFSVVETFPAPQTGKLNLWLLGRPFAGAVPTPPPVDPTLVRASGLMRVDPNDVFGPAPMLPAPFATSFLSGASTDTLSVTVPNDSLLLGFAFDAQAVDLDLSTPAPWAASWSDNDIAVVIGPPSVTRLIPPSATDPAISTYLDNHVAINPEPGVAARHGLFLFLVGTGGKPENQQLVLRAGAARGYHAIGLMYPNTPSVGSLCANSLDPEAFWNVRREVVTGQDLSPLLTVPPSECVDRRLVALLTHLDANYPMEGWSEFLVGGQPDWSKVTVGGHSQGGGHAAVIGKMRSVARVVCFSSPADWQNVANAPATWCSRVGVTPRDRVFGFSHLQDELVPWTQLVFIWASMGLNAFGPSVSVDGATAPFSNSHQLTTSLAHAPAPLYPAPYHSATVVDFVTPKLADGSPAYLSVWNHLCFP